MARSYYLSHIILILKLANVCSKHFAEIDFIKTTRSESFSIRKNTVLLWFGDEKCFQ